jgi:adenosine deaminase
MKDFEDLKLALETRDLKSLKKVRKTDLHAHAYLSAGLEVYRELSPSISPLPPKFHDFKDFQIWLDGTCTLTGIGGYQKVISAAFQRMTEDGIVYAEVSFDYHDCLSMGLTVNDWVRLIQALHAPYRERITLCPEFGLSREEAPVVSLRYLEEAIETGFFRSVDLYGDEFSRPAETFQDIYKTAAAAGMKKKAHLGEFGGATDVQNGVITLELDAVQHGISAAEDPAVMSFLRERGITINVCPSSNLALGRCRSIAEHPIRRLFDHGVKVTLNSDDYMVFGAGVSDEIMSLHESGVFNTKELWQIVRTGLAEQGRS